MDNFVKDVENYINEQIKKSFKSKAKLLTDVPTRLQLIRKCHQKFGNFGSDIAKSHLRKTLESNLRELI
jgi:hypothetical protein